MRSVQLGLTARLLAFVLFLPASAHAQDWDEPWSDGRDRPPRVDLSVSLGMLAPTDWSDIVLLGSISPVSGVVEQVLVRDVRVEPDATYGAAVTYWRGKYGFRAQAALSRSSLVTGGTSLSTDAEAGQDVFSIGVNTWLYDVRGAIGLRTYSPTHLVVPYAFGGFGGITYDLERTVTPPLLTFIERRPPRTDARGDIIIVEDDGREFILAIDELGLETVLALNFGVGADFRIPMGGAGVGLRVEASDHVSRSPLGLRIRELSPFGGLASDTAVRFGTVHHLRVTAGLVVQIGR
jgi:hypothetical protein